MAQRVGVVVITRRYWPGWQLLGGGVSEPSSPTESGFLLTMIPLALYI